MGHYNGAGLALWDVAKKYVLADNFFMGTFGGSFMNHVYLACACVASYPNADKSPAKAEISAVEDDGVSLKADGGVAEIRPARRAGFRCRQGD